jgi:ribose 1,5-bisphosphokinase PhnN
VSRLATSRSTTSAVSAEHHGRGSTLSVEPNATITTKKKTLSYRLQQQRAMESSDSLAERLRRKSRTGSLRAASDPVTGLPTFRCRK